MNMVPVVGAILLATPLIALTAPPPLDVPDGQLGLPGAGVAPNLLLHLSLTFLDAGAAYKDEFNASIDYAGYFNPRQCYGYAERNGYFSAAQAVDAKGKCGGDSFSGSLLNWASMSRLDLLRYALTGGDRIIDEPGLTVLQRAWLPDGAFHPDFYAHATHFARKAIKGASGLTPYNADTVYIVSCRNRILFSDKASGGSCDKAADKKLGEFNVRVKVCDKADSESRPDLCASYKKGAKPEGAIQQNASLMRMGAMGYLVDKGAGDQNFYGGVLRAPLKLVAAAEWDAESGVLKRDPDGSGGSSGLINYVNQHGRRGSYKTADPGAELFYEGLRYLQGRAPTAGSGDVSADDNLAVWTSRQDPITETCQRSTAAVIGHSSFALDRFVPGNARPVGGDSARPADTFHGSFDVMQATRKVGELAGLANLDVRADGAEGTGSFYLAGAAYWAHTDGIRPDANTPLDTLALELDAATKPGLNPLYLAAKFGGFLDRNNDKNPLVTTRAEPADSEWSSDRSTPFNFFSAADPHALIPAVRELFAAARHPRGEVMAHGASGGDYLVQTSYDRQQSSGTLRRYGITRANDGNVSIATMPTWDAAQALPSPAERRIYTSVNDSDGGAQTIEFRWASLPNAQRALFGDAGEARVAYLRGERSLETGRAGGIFRRRATALGDVVHSAPVIVGAPSASAQGIGYPNFHASFKNRRRAVYVGANDGMLHAFDADNGAELFAYVPNALLPNLAELTTPGYVHRSYVDASPGHGDALVGGKWRTVLASGMGMGARGVFALDATDPANFAAGRGVLWEFTEKDDRSIGHIRSAPFIAKLRVDTKDGEPVFRYFVIVASGVNNYKADEDDDAARGALFLLSLDKPASERWKKGANYYKLVTPVSEPGLQNALAPPAFALGPDGSVRFGYAGDLQGNVWRFDFEGKLPWSKAVGPGQGATPLFIARDDAGNRQPISHAPRIVLSPGGGYLVLFGTGKFLEMADLEPSTFAAQSIYAIRDSVAKPAVLVSGRSELARRTASGKGPYAINGEALRYAGSGARKGWFIDLPNWRRDGERAAATPMLVSGAMILDTFAPGASACARRVARTYVLDAVSGLAHNQAGAPELAQVTGDAVDQATALTPPLLFDLGIVAGQRDATGAVAASHSVAVVRPRGDDKPPMVLPVTVKTRSGRLSWREVANWQELHDAAKR